MQVKVSILLVTLATYTLTSRSAPSTPTATSSSSTTATSSPVQPPSFCRLGNGAADAWNKASDPTTMSWAGNMLKVYHNLHHHNRKWYAVLDGGSNSSSIDAGVSANTVIVKLPTTDVQAFQDNIKVCYVPGVTLYIDFPFPAFPDNLGHWAELLLPLYSVLSNPQWRQLLQGGHQYIDRVLLANVRPEILYNWPKEMLAVALDAALPPWPTAAEAASDTLSAGQSTQDSIQTSSTASTTKTTLPPGAVPWDKPLPPLLGEANVTSWCRHAWMLFENLLVVQDRHHILSMPNRQIPQPPVPAAAADSSQCDAAGHQRGDISSGSACDSQLDVVSSEAAAKHSVATPPAPTDLQGFWNSRYQVGFNRPELAAQFRAAAHARQLWGPPLQTSSPSSSSSSSFPRVVTVLLYPEDYPPVVNHYALVDMLRDLTEPYGFKVRTVSLTMGAPFVSHLATVADTGILIARHGPLLATAMLLPPGAAVLELLPYKWEWRGVSRLYYNMTQSTGEVHHWAWRPLDAQWCKYMDPSHARYAGWTASECQGRECLLFHAQAGLQVDLDAVRQLLDRKLPGLLAGLSVEDLAEPWPPAE